jgi:hypothetical protein
MTSLRAVPNDDDYEAVEGEVIDPPGAQASQRSLDRFAPKVPDKTPSAPNIRVRTKGRGFFKRENPDDVAHQRRLERIANKAREAAFTGLTHDDLGVILAHGSVEALKTVEEHIVFKTVPGRPSADLAEELAIDIKNSSREVNAELRRGFYNAASRIMEEES